jgi:hypothetical protein
MAMVSERTKPSAPSKVGTLPSLLSLRYSSETPLAGSVATNSTSRPFSLATARREVVRGLPCVDCQLLWWAALRCVVEPIQAQLRRRRGRATHAVAVDLSERHDCWRTVDGTVQSK